MINQPIVIGAGGLPRRVGRMVAPTGGQHERGGAAATTPPILIPCARCKVGGRFRRRTLR